MGLQLVVNSFWRLLQRSDGKGSVWLLELSFSSWTKRSMFFTNRLSWEGTYDTLSFVMDCRYEWVGLDDLTFALDFGLYSKCWGREVHRRFLILEYLNLSERAVQLYQQLQRMDWFGEALE